MTSEPSNEQLIEQWKSGDEAAFVALYRRNEALRIKAIQHWFQRTNFDEAMCIVSTEFWKAAKNFDTSKGKNFCTVFMRYAHIASIQEWSKSSSLKRCSKLPVIPFEIYDKEAGEYRELQVDEVSAVDKEIDVEERQEARRRMARLPARERQIVRMRCDGLSLDEVGDVLGVSRERIRQIEGRAMRWLRMSNKDFEQEKTRSRRLIECEEGS